MFEPLHQFNKNVYNVAEAYIHRASQFLAMVGKNYLPEQDDDSHANLEWDPDSSKILGRVINGKFRFALDIPSYRLEVLVGDAAVASIGIEDATKEDLFIWVRAQLIKEDLDGSKLKFLDHYEVPEHEVDRGEPFAGIDSDYLMLWATMRSNANILLTDLNDIAGIPSEIRIWPHHFDSGIYYTLADSKAIGAGWAIADSLCDNPYLYIYGWSEKANVDYSGKPELEIGKWIVTNDWKGAVIESTEFSDNPDSHESSKCFMKSVIHFYKNKLS